MSYVDLNPVRAGINLTPESSDYTSIQARIQTYQSPTPEPNQDSSQTTQTPVKLINFIGNEHKNQPKGITFSFFDYMELVDWTGQAVRDDKTGTIAESLPPILSRLGIEQKTWLDTINHYDRLFFRAVGTMEKLKQFANRLGRCWLKGQSAGKRAYKQRQPLPT